MTYPTVRKTASLGQRWQNPNGRLSFQALEAANYRKTLSIDWFLWTSSPSFRSIRGSLIQAGFFLMLSLLTGYREPVDSYGTSFIWVWWIHGLTPFSFTEEWVVNRTTEGPVQRGWSWSSGCLLFQVFNNTKSSGFRECKGMSVGYTSTCWKETYV